MSDRELVLARVRAALSDVPATEPAAWSPDVDDDPAAAYLRNPAVDQGTLTDSFVAHCREYRAHVTLCADDDAAICAAVAEICTRRNVTALVTPADLSSRWCPDGVAPVPDEPPLDIATLDQAQGVLTGCAAAVASTGTIVLDAGAGQGRRLLTLLPDLHICVVRSEQIVSGVPEAIIAIQSVVAGGAPVTLISGPSATSDIELNRVEGVHGPRQLEVIVAGASGP